MKEHKGMRPHDIVILLKILSLGEKSWYKKDLAAGLKISGSEVSESLNRSKIAGLIDAEGKNINRLALLDFLKFGLPYVYPQQPSQLTRGVVTAHGAKPLNEYFTAEFNYVWPYAKGENQGLAITPLHKNVPKIIDQNPELYELLVLVDAIRVGKARERRIAADLLAKKIGSDVKK